MGLMQRKMQNWMADQKPLSIYFVMGEASGDILGSKLLDAFKEINAEISPMGLGGERMGEQGVESLFDISELSVMGITGVMVRLPNLMKRIRQTTADVLKKRPDVLLLIDSPEFSYRVAKAVRKQAPDIKIIKYVAPSVWAWRPGRAAKIAAYVDHVLAILPFEPEYMERLGGPETTYVGHPLSAEMPDIKTADKKKCSTPVKILTLPGSRRSEVKRLMPRIGETLRILKERGMEFNVTLPTLPKLEAEVRDAAKEWNVSPDIVLGDEARLTAFREADLALAASGTVTLELALYKVPMISIYKLDAGAMAIRHMLKGWTASLPNLIADYPFIPERFNEYCHPQYMARMVERLVMNGEERNIQLKGFDLVAKRLKQDSPSTLLAAKKILEVVHK